MSQSETIEKYVLSLIDLLGQKQELIKLNTLSLSKDGTEVKQIFNNTYEKIKDFRNHMNSAKIWLNKIKQDSSIFQSNEIQVHSFSDLIITHVSLRNDTNKTHFEGIYFLLMGNGLVFLQMLSEEKPLRGGVDIGIGIKHNGDEIYGSALSNAYYLESEIAKSIRIVVGKSLYKYIQKTASVDIESKEPIDYDIHFAKECLNIVKQDFDGEYIIDYLSPKFQEFENFKYHYTQAKLFLESQMEYFNRLHQEREYKKYESALKYFQSIVKK